VRWGPRRGRLGKRRRCRGAEAAHDEPHSGSDVILLRAGALLGVLPPVQHHGAPPAGGGSHQEQDQIPARRLRHPLARVYSHLCGTARGRVAAVTDRSQVLQRIHARGHSRDRTQRRGRGGGGGATPTRGGHDRRGTGGESTGQKCSTGGGKAVGWWWKCECQTGKVEVWDKETVKSTRPQAVLGSAGDFVTDAACARAWVQRRAQLQAAVLTHGNSRVRGSKAPSAPPSAPEPPQPPPPTSRFRISPPPPLTP